VHVATVSLESLTAFLRVRGWIPPTSAVASRVLLGTGPTTTTVRVTTDAGATRILRQPGDASIGDARHAASPADLLAVEGEFYRLVQTWPAIAERMATCIGVDRTDHVVALEDLGTTAPLTDLYSGRVLSDAEADDLTAFLLALHGVAGREDELGALRSDGVRLARQAVRFEEPIAAARVDALATRMPRLVLQVDAIRTDLHIRATMRDLGGRFLDGSGTLLHGDFRPARWMPSPRGLRILSPGLATAGPPALDLGYFVAHLLLAAQPPALIAGVLQRYRRGAPVDMAEVSACVGLEIIRSRLGLDPVPGDLTGDRLEAELDYATRLLRGGATVELPL
jgi:aminoglycoside phosphotransferase (APT) family kinase protein